MFVSCLLGASKTGSETEGRTQSVLYSQDDLELECKYVLAVISGPPGLILLFSGFRELLSIYTQRHNIAWDICRLFSTSIRCTSTCRTPTKLPLRFGLIQLVTITLPIPFINRATHPAGTAWIRFVISNTKNDSLLNPSSYIHVPSRCNKRCLRGSIYRHRSPLCIR